MNKKLALLVASLVVGFVGIASSDRGGSFRDGGWEVAAIYASSAQVFSGAGAVRTASRRRSRR